MKLTEAVQEGISSLKTDVSNKYSAGEIENDTGEELFDKAFASAAQAALSTPDTAAADTATAEGADEAAATETAGAGKEGD